jgi:hypothetical protein
MPKRSQKRQGAQDDYRQVVGEVAAAIAKYLTSEEWDRREDLRWLISRRTCRLASLPRREEVSGQDRILTDALAQLVKSGRCELRGEGVEAEVRLRPPRAAGDPSPGNDQDSTPPAGDLPGDADQTPASPAGNPPQDSNPNPNSPAGDPPGANDASPVAAAGAKTSNWSPLPPPVLVRVADLKLHVKARLVPQMSKGQWKRFRADIARRGVQKPIIVTRDNVVIGGRSRTDAARESGQEFIPAVVVDWDEQEQELHMLREALLRRQMTEDQQAMVEERLRKKEEPQMRQERAQKAGRAGGRGRARKPDSLADGVSGELSAPGSAAVGGTSDEAPAKPAKPPKAVPERKRRAARQIDKASPELGDRVLAGEVSLHEAKRELREQGNLPPARAPKFDRGAEVGCPPEPAPAHSPAAGSDHTRAAVRLPLESGTALADALVAAVGADRALELLHEATAAVEASRGRHEADGTVAPNGGPTEESVPLPACEEPGGEKEAADPAEDPLAAATQSVPEPCGQAAQTEEG